MGDFGYSDPKSISDIFRYSSGSVLFVDSDGVFQEDNDNLFFDASTKALVVGGQIKFKAGTNFKGAFDHANTANRSYTFPNASITVAGINLAQTWTATQTHTANIEIGSPAYLKITGGSGTANPNNIGKLYYDNSGPNGTPGNFNDKESLWTFLYKWSTVPLDANTGDPTQADVFHIDTWSYGDGGETQYYTGARGIFVRVFENIDDRDDWDDYYVNPHRGKLNCAAFQVRPFTENEPYTDHRDVNPVAISNQGTVMATGLTHYGPSNYNLSFGTKAGFDAQALYSGSNIYAVELIESGSDLVDQKINWILMRLAKVGSPTGTITFAVFDSSGNAVYTFGTLDAADLSTFPDVYIKVKNETNPVDSYGHLVAANDRIGVKFAGGDSSNYVVAYYSETSNEPDAYYQISTNGTVWANSGFGTASDLNLRVGLTQVAPTTNNPDGRGSINGLQMSCHAIRPIHMNGVYDIGIDMTEAVFALDDQTEGYAIKQAVYHKNYFGRSTVIDYLNLQHVSLTANFNLIPAVADTNGMLGVQRGNTGQTILGIIPKTNISNTAAALHLFMTDYTLDSTNFARFVLEGDVTAGYYNIAAKKGGTGSLYPIRVLMNANEILTFNTNNTVDANSRTWSNFVATSATLSDPTISGTIAGSPSASGSWTFQDTLNIAVSDRNPLVITVDGLTANRNVDFTAYGSTNQLVIRRRRARGSLASPTAVQSGDIVGAYQFNGHDGSAFAIGANIAAKVSENWTPSAHGMRIDFDVTQATTTTNTTILRLDDDLSIKLGSNLRAKLSDSGLTTTRAFTFPDSAGVIVIDTATQTLTNKTLSSPTMSGTIAGSPTVSGVWTWTNNILIGPSTEKARIYGTGTNAQSESLIGRYYFSDSGAFTERNSPLTIRRIPQVTPTGIWTSIYLSQDSVGDGLSATLNPDGSHQNSAFIGAGGIYIKTSEKAGSPRGVLYGITMDMNPTIENSPYTINQDTTALIINNIGTVQGTEAIFLGSSGGTPGKTPTAANPNGWAWDAQIRLTEWSQYGIDISGKYSTVINIGSGVTIVSGGYAIKTGDSHPSRLGKLSLGGTDAIGTETFTVKSGGSNHVVLTDGTYNWGLNIQSSTGNFRITQVGGFGALLTIDNTTGNIKTTKNIEWSSGTAFVGTLDHNISADRTWTFPDVAGTIALLERAQTFTAAQSITVTDSNPLQIIVDAITSQRNLLFTAYGGNVALNHRRANGTQSSPTALVSGDQVGIHLRQGYDGSSFATGASMAGQASENWTTIAHGMRLNFAVTQSTTTTNTTIMRLDDDLTVLMGANLRIQFDDTGLSTKRKFTFPNTAGAVGVIAAAQTWSAVQTFSQTAAFTNSSPFSIANGQTLTVSVTAQTTGGATLTIPNFASVSDTFVFVTLAQTLANKTLTSPTINGAALSGTLSGTPSFSGTVAFTASSPFSVANGQTLTVSVSAQTTGAATLTIPDFAGVSDTFVFATRAQTLSNKTLTSPIINSFANANHNHQDSAGGGQISITSATTGTLTETRGGTNQTSYTLGDLLYSSATDTLSKLAGNTTTLLKVLSQTGNGSVSAAPSWLAVYGTETNNTPITDDADVTIGTGTTYFDFYTIPSAATWYWISGIEWKNGSTVAGNVRAMIFHVDANPPTVAPISLIAFALTVMSGSNSVQRASNLGGGRLVRGGTVVGIAISTTSATATFRKQTGASSINSQKASSLNAPNTDGTAWTASTDRIYGKIYVVPVF